MGVLGNIYCIPSRPGSVPWSTLLSLLVERELVRPPYRSGSPFKSGDDRSKPVWPENWIVPETRPVPLDAHSLRDFPELNDALAYISSARDATITMASPCAAFQRYPDTRNFSAAVALYRFQEPVHFRIGVPDDMSDLADEFPELAAQSCEPRWQGPVGELLWLHGKCVADEGEFLGSKLHVALTSVWPGHVVLADAFL